ncbi:16S rRNA (cytidine(1402)-2'-O)-methyltransferase [Aquabacterium olei]
MTFDANMLLQAARHVAAGQQYPKGALYLVPTPIGNLADISLRAVHVLDLVDAVACEDTRVSGQLLRHLGIDKPLMAVHQHNEVGAAQRVLALLQDGQRVAYVSDAGTPAVSDPGAHLVAAVQAAGLPVVPLAGPSAVTTALSAAGDVHAQGFRFLGFLPAKGAARQTALREALSSQASLVLFEAPHRIADLAADLGAVCPAGTITLCRELSKQFEEIATLPVGGLAAWLDAGPHRQRGEFVLVVHASGAAPDDAELSPAARALLAELVCHMPVKKAAGLVADLTGLPRKALYDAAQRCRNEADAQPD